MELKRGKKALKSIHSCIERNEHEQIFSLRGHIIAAYAGGTLRCSYIFTRYTVTVTYAPPRTQCSRSTHARRMCTKETCEEVADCWNIFQRANADIYFSVIFIVIFLFWRFLFMHEVSLAAFILCTIGLFKNDLRSITNIYLMPLQADESQFVPMLKCGIN